MYYDVGTRATPLKDTKQSLISSALELRCLVNFGRDSGIMVVLSRYRNHGRPNNRSNRMLGSPATLHMFHSIHTLPPRQVQRFLGRAPRIYRTASLA